MQPRLIRPGTRWRFFQQQPKYPFPVLGGGGGVEPVIVSATLFAAGSSNFFGFTPATISGTFLASGFGQLLAGAPSFGVGTFAAAGGSTVLFIAPRIDYQLLIDGQLRKPKYGWEVNAVINGQSNFRCVIASVDGSYRPARDQEVYLYEGGVLIFGGLVTMPREHGMGDEGFTPIETDLSALDFKVLTQRRYINETIPSGTLKAALQRLVTYLPGIVVDPTQVNGPILNDLVYEDVRLEDVLNDLSVLSKDYVWDISFDKKLRMTLGGTLLAPYDLRPTNSIAIGDVSVEVVAEAYANRVIVKNGTLRAQADSIPEQTAHGIWEVVLTAADTLDQVGLDAMAQGYLARSIVTSKRVKYATRRIGLAPGQSQSIVLPKRNLNNDFLITEVRTLRDNGQTKREITAVEGVHYQDNWRDTYRQWGSGSKSLSGGNTGGGGGGTVVFRPPHFLGGNGVEAVRATIAGDWVTASGGNPPGQGAMQVQVDTDARGTVDAVIHARMRVFTLGVTVQARLYDVTAAAMVPGVSPVVDTTSWSSVSWNVTLNAGSHVYELILQPNVADEDVAATGDLR